MVSHLMPTSGQGWWTSCTSLTTAFGWPTRGCGSGDHPEQVWALEQWHWKQPRHYQFPGNLIKLSKGGANPIPSFPSWDSSSHSWEWFWVTGWGKGDVWQAEGRSCSSGKKQSQWSNTESHVWVPISPGPINSSLSQCLILIYLQNTKKKKKSHSISSLFANTQNNLQTISPEYWDKIWNTHPILKNIIQRYFFLLRPLPPNNI